MAVLDAVLRTLSLFNLVTLLWLGLTVLLNAERRRWGTWLAGSSLIAGGLVFAGHLVAVERSLPLFAPEMGLLWKTAWVPFLVAPFVWYLVVAWYTNALGVRWHRLAVAALAVWAIGGSLALTGGAVVPDYWGLAYRLPESVPMVGSLPLAIVVYPVYSIVCLALALIALGRPAESDRFMGAQARLRARPWLVATSIVLLLISLTTGALFGYFLFRAHALGRVLDGATIALTGAADVAIACLVAVAAVLLGRAVVAYEIFTGKALPRHGLQRLWQRSLLVAAGYAAAVGISIGLPVDPLYTVLLATVLMTTFLALLGWRSYAERERGIEQLRPFVASERLFERLVRPDQDPAAAAPALLRELCETVLGASSAALLPIGPIGPLVGQPLCYPPGTTAPRVDLSAIEHDTRALCWPIEHGDQRAGWAVPLWSERGLIGVLALGEKRDLGLYTQEEIEVARATGERLLDTLASSELAGRLMGLQRQRLAESELLDRQARRVLHDDVLPRVHAVMLSLDGVGPADGPAAGALATLAEIHRDIAALLRALPLAGAPDLARLGPVGALRQAVASELAGAFDGVTWAIAPESEAAARALPPLIGQVVYGAAREAVRNAARHARPPGRRLHLTISCYLGEGLVLSVDDDGVGLGQRPAAGGGQGLALHTAMMAIIGGSLSASGLPGGGTRVRLTLPVADLSTRAA